MKKIMKLNNKVKIMLFTVILLFLGTTGLFILYFSGNFKLLSTNSVIAYQCDDGWTKVGDGPTAYCQKFREYTYTCPKYTQKVGNGDSTYCQSCESTLYCPSGWQKVTGNGKPYCRKTETTYTCPKGYKKVGSGSSAYCNQVDYYTYSCPSGYTKVTGQGKPYCRKFFTYNYTCPYATKVGDGPTAYCLKHSGFEYTCPKGYTKIRGNGPPYCRAVLNYSYTCPSGYTKAGDGPSAYCFKGKGSSKKYASTIKKTNYTTKATTARKIYDVVKTTKIPQYFYSDIIATPHYKRVGSIPKLYNTTKDTETKKNCTKTKTTRHSAYAYENIHKFSGTKYEPFYYYNQNDYTDPYGYGGYGSIKDNGCAPTSIAMVVSSIRGKKFSPVEVTNYLCNNGGCTRNNGTNISSITPTLEAYGVNVIETEDSDLVKAALKDGSKLVIENVCKGHFTSNAHFIVLRGMTSDGRVIVADPNKKSNNKEWDFNTIKSESCGRYGQYWIVSKK